LEGECYILWIKNKIEGVSFNNKSDLLGLFDKYRNM